MTASSAVFEQPKSMPPGGTSKPSWLQLYSKIVCAAVASLIFFGALVTSHDAGLAVPDWPTTYGENMFLYPPSKWVGPIFYEHFHRLKASFVGLLTVILTIWIFRAEKRRWVKTLAALALIAVIVQGLLGGLTVLWKLPDAVSVAHGMLAQTFFCLTIVIAYTQSRELRTRLQSTRASGSKQLFHWALFAWAVVYMQLFFGAVMRHGGAGIAIPDFPTSGGLWIPQFNESFLAGVNELRRDVNLAPASMYQVVTHSLHRFWAYVVVLAVGLFAWKATRAGASHALGTLAFLLGAGIVAQFTLGVLTVWSVRHPYLASVHVVVGALILGLCVLAALRAYPIESSAASKVRER